MKQNAMLENAIAHLADLIAFDSVSALSNAPIADHLMAVLVGPSPHSAKRAGDAPVCRGIARKRRRYLGGRGCSFGAE